MLNKILTLLSLGSIGALLYYWINDGEYNTIFLPFVEGVISAGLLLLYFSYKKAKKSLANNQITLLPIFTATLILILTIVFNVALDPFGSDRVAYIDGNHSALESIAGAIVSALLFPLGGIGIPLGAFISFLWPVLLVIGKYNVAVLLLLIPAWMVFREIKVLAKLLPSQGSTACIWVNIVCPALIVLIIFPALHFLSAMRAASAAEEEERLGITERDRQQLIEEEMQTAEPEKPMLRSGEFADEYKITVSRIADTKPYTLASSIPISWNFTGTSKYPDAYAWVGLTLVSENGKEFFITDALWQEKGNVMRPLNIIADNHLIKTGKYRIKAYIYGTDAREYPAAYSNWFDITAED